MSIDREPSPEACERARALPDLLNGYPVIASAPFPVEQGLRNARVVIVDRGEQPQRFVCAVHCYGDAEWMWGDYCSTIERALRSFTERLARKYRLHEAPAGVKFPDRPVREKTCEQRSG